MLVNMVVEMLTKVRMSVEEMNNFKYDGNNKMISKMVVEGRGQ